MLSIDRLDAVSRGAFARHTKDRSVALLLPQLASCILFAFSLPELPQLRSNRSIARRLALTEHPTGLSIARGSESRALSQQALVQFPRRSTAHLRWSPHNRNTLLQTDSCRCGASLRFDPSCISDSTCRMS